MEDKERKSKEEIVAAKAKNLLILFDEMTKNYNHLDNIEAVDIDLGKKHIDMKFDWILYKPTPFERMMSDETPKSLSEIFPEPLEKRLDKIAHRGATLVNYMARGLSPFDINGADIAKYEALTGREWREAHKEYKKTLTKLQRDVVAYYVNRGPSVFSAFIRAKYGIEKAFVKPKYLEFVFPELLRYAENKNMQFGIVKEIVSEIGLVDVDVLEEHLVVKIAQILHNITRSAPLLEHPMIVFGRHENLYDVDNKIHHIDSYLSTSLDLMTALNRVSYSSDFHVMLLLPGTKCLYIDGVSNESDNHEVLISPEENDIYLCSINMDFAIPKITRRQKKLCVSIIMPRNYKM